MRATRQHRLSRQRLAAVAAILAFAACTPDASSGGADTTLRAAVAGVCEAQQALPDEEAARRAFTNVAHDALHRLAADPRLERVQAAPILESMQRVESDFAHAALAKALPSDLAVLRLAATRGLMVLSVDVPTCAG